MGDPRVSATNFPPSNGDEEEMLSNLFQMRNHAADSSNASVKKDPGFEAYFDIVESRSTKVKTEIEEYWAALKEIPIAVMLLFCIQKAESNGPAHDYLYRVGINRLWHAGLLPVSKQGKHRVLGDFQSDEHIHVIENIRCVKAWGLLEKEELVNCYMKFSYDLARITFGMFHVAFDPDRTRVGRKSIKYELFMDFVQLLSERDVLIAKLLYFGAPNIEGVIALKIAALDMEKLEIKFDERTIHFPKHLMKDIDVYIQSRKDRPNDFVFVNVRGKQVERVHLNQAFMRASSKVPGAFKITPATLLKTV